MEAQLAFGDEGELLKGRLTTWIIYELLHGNSCPKVMNEIIEKVQHQRSLSVHERAD